MARNRSKKRNTFGHQSHNISLCSQGIQWPDTLPSLTGEGGDAPSSSPRQRLRVVRKVVTQERGNEVIAVVIPRLQSQIQGVAHSVAGLL